MQQPRRQFRVGRAAVANSFDLDASGDPLQPMKSRAMYPA